MKISKLIISLSWGAILSICSGAAFAVPTAPTLSDQFAIYNPDGSLQESVSIFEDGSNLLDYPGFYKGPYPYNQGGEGLACPGPSCYSAGWGFANPALAGLPVLYLFDGNSLSDYLGIYIDVNAGPAFYFASDVGTGPESGPSFSIGCIVVHGSCDVTGLLSPTAIERGYTATFFSDGDVLVPEPVTLSLFGAGLAGTIAMRRRNKKIS